MSNGQCGIDINPVAVTASTTNYVLSLLSSHFSIDEFHSNDKKITIPVYFGDSMLSPSLIKDGQYSIPTSDGEILYSTNITLADFSVNTEGSDVSNKSGQSYAKAQHKLSLLGKFTDMVGNPPWMHGNTFLKNIKRRWSLHSWKNILRMKNKAMIQD